MSKHQHVFGELGQDPSLPSVTLRIAGAERHLVFDFNAIARAEQVTGINLLQASFSDYSAASLRGLLWASLLRDNPNLTLDEVGSWLTMHNLGTVAEAVRTAWFASVTEPSSEEATPGEDHPQT